MAVIGALLVVMVATVLVTGLIQRQAADVRAMESALAHSQGRLILNSGLDWARLVLLSDGRRHALTAPDQLWAIPVEDTRISQGEDGRVAVFSGRIYDEQGKFNLRNLAQNGTVQAEAYETLQRLLTLLGQPQELASQIARRVATAQVEVGPDGVIRRGPLTPTPTTVDALLSLGTIDTRMLERMRPHMTILPDATPVNANTATAEVLAAVVQGLALPQARTLVAQRDRGVWFRDAADFTNRLANPELEASASQISVNSDWFLVKGAVTLDRSVISTQALVHRNGRANPETVWTMELH